MTGCRRLLGPALLLAALLVAAVGPAQAAPGSLDRSFGKGGKVVTRFGGGSDAQAVALQRDGKIVVAGSAFNDSATTFAVARYTKRGALDHSFGRGGIVRTAIGSSSAAYAVAIQPDGKILTAGVTYGSSTESFALVRYRRNGSLDAGFGTGGTVVTAFPGFALALAIQPDRKIVAGGAGGGQFTLVRYRAGGSLDPSFGTGGIVSTKVGSRSSHISALALLPDGMIVAAGSVSIHEGSGMGFARYKPNGALDSSFGADGTKTMFEEALTNNSAQAVRMQGTRILVAGSIESNFALFRLKADGSLDMSFGERPDGTTREPAGGWATSLAVQRDGRIVLAGSGGEGGKFDFVVARYTHQGNIDSSFGPEGFVTTRLSAGQDEANAVAIQRDGRIVAAGAADEYQPGAGLGLVRYLAAYTCRVPDVRGRALADARRAIRHGHCSVGGVERAFSDAVRNGRVISQQPAPETTGPDRMKVRLVVSKGRER